MRFMDPHHSSLHIPVVLLLAFAIAIPAYRQASADSACHVWNTSVTPGTRSEEIALLQNFLMGQGYQITNPTGRFGPMTQAAVKQFQSAHGINGTGLLGTKTRGVLNSMCILADGSVREDQPANTGTGAVVPPSIARHDCAGLTPIGPAVAKGSSAYTDGYGTTEWTFVVGRPGACQWTCVDGYGYNNGGCQPIGTFSPIIPGAQTCGGTKPTDNGHVLYGRTSYSLGYGTTKWTFVSSDPGACQYTCINGGVASEGQCLDPEISTPVFSTKVWLVDDVSTWPTVSVSGYIGPGQAIRVKGADGTQYVERKDGARSVKLTSTPPVGDTTLETYVYDFNKGVKLANAALNVRVNPSKTDVLPPPVVIKNGITWDATPASVPAGQSFTISVLNSGTKTWGTDHNIAISSASNALMNYAFISTGTLAPGSRKKITLTAPSSPGNYVLRALEQNVEWFGESKAFTVTQ